MKAQRVHLVGGKKKKRKGERKKKKEKPYNIYIQNSTEDKQC